MIRALLALFQGRPVTAMVLFLCAVAALMVVAAGVHVAVIAAAFAITPTILLIAIALIRRKPRARGAEE
jgi:hypothetical protein